MHSYTAVLFYFPWPRQFDAFMWRSDSPDATGGVLMYELNSYATVVALELEFPVGDTYKFDVELYNDAADFPSEDLFATITVRVDSDVRCHFLCGGGGVAVRFIICQVVPPRYVRETSSPTDDEPLWYLFPC